MIRSNGISRHTACDPVHSECKEEGVQTVPTPTVLRSVGRTHLTACFRFSLETFFALKIQLWIWGTGPACQCRVGLELFRPSTPCHKHFLNQRTPIWSVHYAQKLFGWRSFIISHTSLNPFLPAWQTSRIFCVLYSDEVISGAARLLSATLYRGKNLVLSEVFAESFVNHAFEELT